MPVYGFNDQDDFNRARDAIRKIESERMDVRPRRRLYPGGVGGDAGLVSYIITDIGGDPARQLIAYNGTVKAKKLASDTQDAEVTDDDDIVTVGFDEAEFCVAKGNIVFASNLPGRGLYAVSGGLGVRFKGIVDGYDIEPDEIGDVEVGYDYAWGAADAYCKAYNVTGKILSVGQIVVVDLFQTYFATVGNETSRLAITAVLECSS